MTDSPAASSPVSPAASPATQPALRVAFVPGVTVRKWTKTWAERYPDLALEVTPMRDAVHALRVGDVDMAFLRRPFDGDRLAAITLYEEVPVAVLPLDHALAAAESITSDDLSTIDGMRTLPEDGRVKEAVEVVAAGVGALVLPHSLARLHARQDVVAVPISDGVPTQIALAWMPDESRPTDSAPEFDAIQEFIGIVRGRTAASSRGGSGGQETVVESRAPGTGASEARRKPDRRASPARGRSPKRSSSAKRGRR